MTTVLSAGDSFVWGSELADSPHGGPDGYSRSTFPALLATDYKCAAYPGHSNTDIVRSVKEDCRSNRYNLVIVCWTWPTRDDQLTGDRQIVDLQEYLEYHKQPYLFTCADNCVFTKLNPKIHWDNWFLFPPAKEQWLTTEPRGFYQWAVENKYQCGIEKHPLEAAHQAAAELMKDKFNELVKKSLQQNHVGISLS